MATLNPVARQYTPALAVVIAIMVLGPATRSLACKYSVRDVTFVTLGNDRYSLHLRFGEGVSDETRQAVGRVAESVLTESTVQPMVTSGNAPASGGLTAEIESPAGDRFDVSAVFSSVDLAKTDDVWQRFESIVTSPARQRISEQMFEAHSIVLVVESTDATINERAGAIAAQAIERIDAGLDTLPKPPPRGPARVTVAHKDRAAERVLLGSLELADLPDGEAALVVLCGRMRPVGPALVVPGAASEDLLKHLHVVGADCECGLDRSWMQATALPHRWTSEDEAHAFKALGFDPENALVRAEISRILTRGPSSQPGAAGGAPDPLGFLEYSEVEIGGPAETDPPVTAASEQATPAQPVQAPAAAAGPGTALSLHLIITLVAITAVIAIGALVAYLILRRAT